MIQLVGDPLLAVDFAQVWIDIDQPSRSHAAQMPVSFNEHRVGAVERCGYG